MYILSLCTLDKRAREATRDPTPTSLCHTQLHQKMAIRTVVLNRYIEKCEVPNAKIFSIEDSSEEFELQDGQVLVETLFLSVDPYMRYKMMSDTSTFYLQPWKVAQPCYGGGVGVVIQSAANGLAAGDFVESFFWPWKTTCKVEGKLLNKVSNIFLFNPYLDAGTCVKVR